MCQLLGMSCNTPATIDFSFTGFAERGGRTADHVDGWGIGFHAPGGCRVFHDDRPASDSPLARFVRDSRIHAHSVVAHVRKATQGEVSLANCHPFQREWAGRTWLFANNGDLADFHPALDGSCLPVGSTDSERAFCLLMQHLRARFGPCRAAPPWHALAPAIAALCGQIARHGNFNILLTDGEAVYAHCSSRLHVLERRHPFPQARLVDCDLTLDLAALNGEGDCIAIVATEPLTHDEPWHPMATGETRVFIAGETVWSHVNPATRRFVPPAAPATVSRS